MTQTLNGQRTGYTYDDEDRLTSITLPDNHTDSFSYNGLGMRLTKNDPTGNYAYYTDGVSPASDVLSDNYSTFTPGIGETKGAAGGGYASVFYLADASGNSRGLLNGSGSSTDGYNWDAFGNLVSRFGSNPTMFAWNEKIGYQTDNDDGLTLLGHRYYDKRTGRFISQDPTGAGGNWYAYADNDPINAVDPSGLVTQLDGSLNVPGSWSSDDISNFLSDNYQDGEYKVTNGNGSYYITIGTSFSDSFMQGGMGLNMGNPGMFANGPEREPINPNRGHGPQGTGQSGSDRHTRPRAGDKGNQNFGKGGYSNKPPSKRELARQAEKEAQREAQDAARAERQSSFSPSWTPPVVTPVNSAGTSSAIVIIGLIILKILTGPLPVP